MEDNKYIYMDYDNIKVNKYGLKCNKSIPCVMYEQGGKWVVENKDLCSKEGTDCTVWLSSFICVLTLPSNKYHKSYRGGLKWLN